MKEKHKPVIIFAISAVAVGYIILFNILMEIPKTDDGIAINTVYYGSEYLLEAENTGTQKADIETNTEAAIPYTETASEKININTASLEKLMELDGIGESYATRIIEYRDTYGFKTKEELKNVKGIGDKIYAKIESFITV
jgi:competence protein ComEA